MTTHNEAAIYILTTIARARLEPTFEVPSSPEIRSLLTAAFGEMMTPSSATEGEIAEAALDVLTENSELPNRSVSWQVKLPQTPGSDATWNRLPSP